MCYVCHIENKISLICLRDKRVQQQIVRNPLAYKIRRKAISFNSHIQTAHGERTLTAGQTIKSLKTIKNYNRDE